MGKAGGILVKYKVGLLRCRVLLLDGFRVGNVPRRITTKGHESGRARMPSPLYIRLTTGVYVHPSSTVRESWTGPVNTHVSIFVRRDVSS